MLSKQDLKTPLRSRSHGKRSFALLEYLAQWFDIETRKTMGKSLFAFSARNKSS